MDKAKNMDKEFIGTLHKKEQELSKQLDSIRTTIAIFQNGEAAKVFNDGVTGMPSNTIVPDIYSDELTWKERVLFALGVLKKGFVTEIVDELKKHDTKADRDFLIKRITITASNMKADKVLGATVFGRKFKYFIK